MARIIAQNHNQVEMHLTPNDGPVCQAPDHAQVKSSLDACSPG